MQVLLFIEIIVVIGVRRFDDSALDAVDDHVSHQCHTWPGTD